MRPVAPVFCALLLIGGIAGCASSDATALPATAEAEIDEFEAALEELPGVDDAHLTTSASGTQVHLAVELDGDVTPDQVEVIAVEANTLRTAELPEGVYPGQIELHLGESVYTHFSTATEEALREQASFWVRLTHTGVESVSMRTYAQPLGESPGESPLPSSSTSSPDAAPLLMNTPTGRYVGVTLPDDADEADAAIDELGSVPDPGSSIGEWHIISSDARIRAEFAAPTLPATEDIGVATTLLSVLEGIDDDATLSLRITRGESMPHHIAAEMTAFDESLEDADAETVEDALRETPIWPATIAMVETLKTTGADFDVSLLSNTLHDVGSFVFEVSMVDCEFAGDEAWPGLSSEVFEALEHARGAGGVGRCPSR